MIEIANKNLHLTTGQSVPAKDASTHLPERCALIARNFERRLA